MIVPAIRMDDGDELAQGPIQGVRGQRRNACSRLSVSETSGKIVHYRLVFRSKSAGRVSITTKKGALSVTAVA